MHKTGRKAVLFDDVQVVACDLDLRVFQIFAQNYLDMHFLMEKCLSSLKACTFTDRSLTPKAEPCFLLSHKDYWD